jgi:hypothetical protein
MGFLRTQSVVLSAFALLFFFATTADFMATSVIGGGHDANTPVFRIEHKSIGEKLQGVQPDSATAHPIQLIALADFEPITLGSDLLLDQLASPIPLPVTIESLRC